MDSKSIVAIIAAAGIGKRVGADIPKQYLPLLNKTIIEHSIQPFLDNPKIQQVVVSIADNDIWFKQLTVACHTKIKMVTGGKERVDSVLAALQSIDQHCDVLVHDAARPCLSQEDLNKLIEQVQDTGQGAILATQVRDTMKRSDASALIKHTVERENLWHALTPQMFEKELLINAIVNNKQPQLITDEASAIEMADGEVKIVAGRSDNLKVTRAEDLLLAEFYLSQKETNEENA